MSVNDQITRIKNNVTNSLSTVQEKGVIIPAGANSDSLPGLIAQITGGAAEIEEVTNTSGGKTVYINSEPERLPEGFTRLKYIQSDGRQHVDTLFKPNNNTRVVMDVDVLSPATSFLFGSRANSAANAQSTSFSFVQINGMSLRSDYGATETAISVNPIQRLQIDKNMNGTTVNGVYVSASSQTFDSLYNLVLFTVNTAGTINSTKTSMLLRSSQIYDNGTLVRNYIPCMNASGEAGLWDTVTQAFFGDAAGVGFVAGPVVLDYELPEGFEELEYIKASGSQYLDTGFIPNQDTRVYVECAFGVSTSGTLFLFGSRKSSSANLYQFCTSTSGYRTDYNTNNTAVMKSSSYPGKFYIDKNKNVTDLNGEYVYTHTYASFECPGSMYLFGTNNNGSFYNGVSGSVYSCLMWDNGTIIRYYVPCRTNTGEVGLWDAVNSVFCGDAAGVGFIAGPKKGVSKVVLENETLIDLTGDTISPETVLAGFIGHGADGAQFVGELVQKAGGRPFAHGKITLNEVYQATVSGLSFTPTIVLMTYDHNAAVLLSGLMSALADNENGLLYVDKTDYYSSVYVSAYNRTSTPNVSFSATATGFTLASNSAAFRGTYHWYAIGAEG